MNSEIQIDVTEGSEPIEVRFNGVLTRRTVASAFQQLDPLIQRNRPTVFEMSGITSIDSAGLALVANAIRRLDDGGGLSLRGIRGELREVFDIAGWTFPSPSERETMAVGFTEAVGSSAESAMAGIYYYLYIISETVYHALISPFKGERPRFRIFFDQMALLGAGSASIVWLIALLVGLTTAFQAAYELRSFGANIYIADLVSISMMTELGPLMAAIIVSGRSGAAITAEIGTMQVNEEVDALRLIGIRPIQYLVVPRVWAVVISQAFLGITSAMVGIFGGFIIGITRLDLSPMAFLHEAISSLVLMDIFNNLIKSAIFGFIIVTVGAFYGLRVKGGAEGVGRSTTNSVVTSIFLIIVADCIYSFL